MTFQRAPPEVNGLASITPTPGWIRSSHVLMFLGLPLRTTKTTTLSVTIPLVGVLLQLASTIPSSTRRVDVGREREGDHVGREPGIDGAALVAGCAVGRFDLDAAAVRRGLPERDDRVVCRFRRAVGDQGERAGLCLERRGCWRCVRRCRWNGCRPSRPSRRARCARCARPGRRAATAAGHDDQRQRDSEQSPSSRRRTHEPSRNADSVPSAPCEATNPLLSRGIIDI